LMVIRQMVQQFALPIEIVGSPTLRAPDGLALSSRNNYLSATERQEAVALSQTLQSMAQALRGGATDVTALDQTAMTTLSARGSQPDYLTVRRRNDLQTPAAAEVAALAQNAGLVVLGAAKLGKTRLIDNLEV